MKPLHVALLGVCAGILSSSCAPSSQQDPRIPEYAAQCNNGLVASCIAMNEIYSQARTQVQIDDNDALAAHVRFQNYWLSQQSSNDAFNAQIQNQIDFTRSQLVR